MTKRIFLAGIIVFAAFHSQGQFTNIRLDESKKDNPYVCEPSIAINRKDPQNIVAASVLNNIYATHDGGKTWKHVKVESPLGVYGDPALISDNKGKFYFFHLSDPTQGNGGYDSDKLDRIVVQESSDGGLTWSAGQSIGLNAPKDQDKQWPATDAKGNLYLTWTQFDKYGDTDPSCHSNILFSKSKNGEKWSEPIQVNQTPGNCLDSDDTAEGAVPAVAFEGKVFVAWANQGKIFFDRSFDGGKTWLTNDLAVAEITGGWDLEIPGHDRSNGMPVLIADQSKTLLSNSLYLVWADQRNGENDTDIWFMRSHNGGDNWSLPARVNDDVPGKHQYLPWITVDNVTGALYIIYYDRRNHEDNGTDVYLAYSQNGGNSFTNFRISETPFHPTDSTFFGDYNNIAAHNGIVTPVWTRMDHGVTSVWTAVIREADLSPKK